MSAKKGQKQIQYSEEVKMEVVRLIIMEHLSQRQVQAMFGIRSRTQIMDWVKKYKAGEPLGEIRGRPRKQFKSLEEENAYLKTQLEYLKKLNPNLHGEGSWINRSDSKS